MLAAGRRRPARAYFKGVRNESVSFGNVPLRVVGPQQSVNENYNAIEAWQGRASATRSDGFRDLGL